MRRAWAVLVIVSGLVSLCLGALDAAQNGITISGLFIAFVVGLIVTDEIVNWKRRGERT